MFAALRRERNPSVHMDPICEKNFGFIHKSGILLPVSSLPSPFGIGTFGKSAYDFVDFLNAAGQTCWQALPLNPTSYGDSPYQSPSSFAGNPYFIDPDLLAADGLLTAEELDGVRVPEGRIDYGRLFETRYPLLRLAYARFFADEAFSDFCRKNGDWLDDYALFMALKVHYNHRPWVEWDDEHREIASARAVSDRFAAECGFWKWVQYTFFSQWQPLLDYAHRRGIRIIGDMPIYVAHDSMEVWREPEQFLLDEDYAPTVVAGCPPDAYSEVGQLWGNPIYNWPRMEKEGFTWWINRVKRSFALYDLLRIDHFRGFAGYYVIPAGETTAVGGHWEVGPGVALFDAIREAYPDSRIIAEDLGHITDDVRALLDATAFPGMKVIQFAFYDEDNEYLPRMYATDNCIVYTSTHDSDCTATWYDTLDEAARARFAEECPMDRGQPPVDTAIALAMQSRANLAVICMQDYLGLTSEEGRMNVPSVPAGNWTWRLSPAYATHELVEHIRSLSASGNRLK